MKINYSTLFPLLSVVMLSGCLLHSVNENPKTQIVPNAAFSSVSEEPVFHNPWWQSFDRPALNAFMDQSLMQNFDVAQAVAVLEQAQAIARQTNTEHLPQINIEGGTSQGWQGSESQRGSAEISTALSWEVDVWNRIGSAAKADHLEVQARAADVDAVKLSLSAEVANAYFGAVAAHEQIALLKEQLKLDTDLEELLNLRLENGVGTNVDLLQQQARVADSATLIPVAESDLAVFENRLDVLLGKAPDAQARVPEKDTLDFASNLPAIGVPAALLLNRPDLMAARAELIAADTEIGTAIADRLPRITLSGSYGLVDGTAFNGPVSMVMGAFIQPLLDWGQRKAEVKRNEALYRERLAAYTQLYLEAVEDVESALIQESKQREFIHRLDARQDILQRAANAAEERYKEGVDDYQPVIDALRELRTVERSLVQEKLNLLNFRIDLFRAIGGPIVAEQASEQKV